MNHLTFSFFDFFNSKNLTKFCQKILVDGDPRRDLPGINGKKGAHKTERNQLISLDLLI
jgi:hypothetical protein